MQITSAILIASSLLTFAAIACDGDDDVVGSDNNNDASVTSSGNVASSSSSSSGAAPDSGEDAGPGAQAPGPIEIRFRAVDADGTTVACGTNGLKIAGLEDARLGDLRLFVHDVALFREDGTAVNVELEQDGVWQTENVALLDFENQSAECEYAVFGKATTAATNTVVHGTPTASGPFVGVRFVLGVPVALNHVPVDIANAPLSSTGMDHGQADGRQFLRTVLYSPQTSPDGGITGTGDHNLLMLRSVCNNVTADGGIPAAAEECSKPNRPVIELRREGGFDPATHSVLFDVAELFSGYSRPLGTPGPEDLSGTGRVDCYGPLHAGNAGGSGIARCGTFYPKLGLDYTTGRASGMQSVFSIE